VAIAQRPERLGRRDLLVEPLLGGVAGAGPDQAVDPADVGVAIEQHAQRHLADEAGGADEQDGLAAQGRGDVEAVGGGWELVIATTRGTGAGSIGSDFENGGLGSTPT
jgi:uncharacterized protein YidB (DUF937 family)